MSEQAPIALLCSFSGAGGVERMMAHLASGLLAHGERVDVLLVKARSPHLETLPPGVRRIHLGSHHATSLLPLLRYLHANRPRALLAAKHRGMMLAACARALGERTPMAGRLGTAPLASMVSRNTAWRFTQRLGMRWAYSRLDALVAVSQGVAGELQAAMGRMNLPIMVLPNPVVSDAFLEAASLPCPHPWLEATEPCLVAIGRLTPQKDMATLLEAMALVRSRHKARLLILGDGPLRMALEQQRKRLGLDEVVQFVGFAAHPAAYLARARLFVLSSRWEGSPNALTEALALGCPVVATDCPHGPRELLRDGALGRLVPVGDVTALAGAISTALGETVDRSALQQAVLPHHVLAASAGYLEMLLDLAATRHGVQVEST
jgi:glycosyltransferase involved in cell wall biosynthesis